LSIEDSIRLFFSRFKKDDKQAGYDLSHLTDGTIGLRLIRYQPGSDYVGYLPSYFFAIIKASNPYIEVGRCDLRVGEAPEIAYAGHIGYRVHLPYRGHHYAKRASRLLLGFAHEIGINEILITCDPDNIPSRRTLEDLNGDYHGIVRVPQDSACYENGDRLKCQFYYQTKDFAFKRSR
jgi:hypothetical protein